MKPESNRPAVERLARGESSPGLESDIQVLWRPMTGSRGLFLVAPLAWLFTSVRALFPVQPWVGRLRVTGG
jgi:hypothetical protein